MAISDDLAVINGKVDALTASANALAALADQLLALAKSGTPADPATIAAIEGKLDAAKTSLDEAVTRDTPAAPAPPAPPAPAA